MGVYKNEVGKMANKILNCRHQKEDIVVDYSTPDEYQTSTH